MVVSKTNPDLYERIMEFGLDIPMSEYTFSIRLAKENFWTRNFTAKAIIEYKKFMYMAAISDTMVSPSKIVDTVWHQHLTFTQSYSDLCQLLGKNIQHVPSTRSRVDAERFATAKKKTIELYRKEFGTPPKDIWEYDTMYDSLNMPKARFKVRSVMLAALLTFIVLLVPGYYLLLPVYARLGTAGFFFMYLSFTFALIVILVIYNRMTLRSIFESIDKSSFVFSLDPSELIYLKRVSDYVVHMKINEMIIDKKLEVDKDKKIVAVKDAKPDNAAEYVVFSRLGVRSAEYTTQLINHLKSQPVFSNTENVLKAFRKYFWKSRAFGNLFNLNLGVVMLILLPGGHKVSDGNNARQTCRSISAVFDNPFDCARDRGGHHGISSYFDACAGILCNEEGKISI
jgi:hypothetical protein